MAMSLPIAIPSPSNSPVSDESSQPPRTPLSPSNIPALILPASPESLSNQPPQQNSATSQIKRKPSRRANTAERRATHNAVERQRRETLNGRFLVCHRNFCSRSVLISLVGPRRPTTQPFANSPSLQVFNRQLIHRPYSCVSPSPPLGLPRA